MFMDPIKKLWNCFFCIITLFEVIVDCISLMILNKLSKFSNLTRTLTIIHLMFRSTFVIFHRNIWYKSRNPTATLFRGKRREQYDLWAPSVQKKTRVRPTSRTPILLDCVQQKKWFSPQNEKKNVSLDVHRFSILWKKVATDFGGWLRQQAVENSRGKSFSLQAGRKLFNFYAN